MGVKKKQGSLKISILVCTYNRSEVLGYCLEALVAQSASAEQFEVIIVDNNSTDHTAGLCKSFTDKYRHFHYFLETEKGLSQARNRAYKEARSPWLLYLDDDAKAEDGLVSSAIALTQKYPYDIYGGVVYPWYKYGHPKWYRDAYAEKDLSGLKRVELQKDPKAYAKGCLMLIRRSLLEQYGDFVVGLGMSGEKIAYGEETELQTRFRKHGAQLAFAPNLKAEHLVPEYKMKLDWFFQSAYALGRDNVTAKQIRPTIFNIVLICVTAIFMVLINLLIFTPRLLSKTYYYENWAIDVFRKVVKRIGTVHTLLLNLSKVSSLA